MFEMSRSGFDAAINTFAWTALFSKTVTVVLMTADTEKPSVRGVPPEIALDRIISFAQQLGEDHLVTCFSAPFPLAISLELLYPIGARFVPLCSLEGRTKITPF